MNSRMDVNLLPQYAETLTFDYHSVHTIDERSYQILQLAEQLINAILTANKPLQANLIIPFQKVCNQLILYYIFLRREPPKAKRFFTDLTLESEFLVTDGEGLEETLDKHLFAQIERRNALIFSYFIDFDDDNIQILEEQLQNIKSFYETIYSEAHKSNVRKDLIQKIILALAFVDPYISMVKQNLKGDVSFESLDMAIETLTSIEEKSPECAMDMAMILHAQTRVFIKQNKLTEAASTVEKALVYWDKFNENTQTFQPMTFATMRLHASILLHTSRSMKALTLINITLEHQEICFSRDNHIDLADSYLTRAEILEATEDLASALVAFKDVLHIQQALQTKSISTTKHAINRVLLKQLSEEPSFNKESPETFDDYSFHIEKIEKYLLEIIERAYFLNDEQKNIVINRGNELKAYYTIIAFIPLKIFQYTQLAELLQPHRKYDNEATLNAQLKLAFQDDFPRFDINDLDTNAIYTENQPIVEKIIPDLLAQTNYIPIVQRNLIAQYCLELGAYYSYVKREPITALKYMTIAHSHITHPLQFKDLPSLALTLKCSRLTIYTLSNDAKLQLPYAELLINSLRMYQEPLTPELTQAHTAICITLGLHYLFLEPNFQMAQYYLNHPRTIAELGKFEFLTLTFDTVGVQDYEIEIANYHALNIFSKLIESPLKEIELLETKLHWIDNYLNFLAKKMQMKSSVTSENIENTINQICLCKAFINRCIAILKLYQISEPATLPDDKEALNFAMDGALFQAHKLIADNTSLQNQYPLCMLELAEIAYLTGLTYICKSNLNAANQAFIEATTYWKKLNNFYPSIDPMVYTAIAHSRTEVLKQLGQLAEATQILKNLFQLQRLFYKTELRADMAETLHLSGKLHEAQQHLKLALKFYHRAILISQKILPRTEIIETLADNIYKILFSVFHDLASLPRLDSLPREYLKDYEANHQTIGKKLKLFFKYEKYLKPDQLRTVAERCLELGTFYNTIHRDASRAIIYTQYAATHLENCFRKFSAYAQTALCYQRFHHATICTARIELTRGISVQNETREYINNCYNTGMAYCNKIFEKYTNHSLTHSEVKILAQAYWVKALLELHENEAPRIEAALQSLRMALHLYDSIDLLDDNWAETLNLYAVFLSKQPDSPQVPAAIFQQLDEYWATNTFSGYPAPALFHNDYGDYWLAEYQVDKDLTKLRNAFVQYKKAGEVSSTFTSSKLLSELIIASSGFAMRLREKFQYTQDLLSRLNQNPRPYIGFHNQLRRISVTPSLETFTDDNLPISVNSTQSYLVEAEDKPLPQRKLTW
jgi:hypothetical protein